MTDRDLLDEQMDRRLTDLGARWRDALPAPAVPAVGPGRPGRRWLVPAAAAAAVVVILGTTFAVTRDRDPEPAGPSPAPCGPGDLVVTDRVQREAHLEVGLGLAPDAAPCTVEGYPEITLLHQGTVLAADQQEVTEDAESQNLVVEADHGVVATFDWGIDCPPADNDRIVIAVGDGAEVEIDGFGETCGGYDDLYHVDIYPLEQSDPYPDTALIGLVRIQSSPANPFPPSSGTVTATGDAGSFSAPILNEDEYDGDYRLNLPAGDYDLVVTSPDLGGHPCSSHVRVVPGQHATQHDITCPVDATPTATATGTVTKDGGPTPGATVPLTSGDITFRSRDGATGSSASINPDGTYEVELPAGAYDIVVRSPELGGQVCRDGAGITGGTVNEIDVSCPIE